MAKAIAFGSRLDADTSITILQEVARARGQGVQQGYQKALADFIEISEEIKKVTELNVVLPERVVKQMEYRMREYGFES